MRNGRRYIGRCSFIWTHKRFRKYLLDDKTNMITMGDVFLI